MLMTAIMLYRQQRLARAFLRAGAISAEYARRAEELDVTPGMAWHHLLAHGVLRCPAEGRYFLDVASWQRIRRRRRRAWLVIGAVFLVLVWLAWLMVQSA